MEPTDTIGGGQVLLVKCGFCRGNGTVGLAHEYAATFHALASQGEMCGAELARYMRIKATAMNNRLVSLERHGLATSRVVGRRRVFKAISVEKQ